MSQLQRTLGLNTTIALVVGGVIGSGIFMKPAVMAAGLGNGWLLLSVWLVAGIITWFGAMSNAELAAMFPNTGGQYVFFQQIYGEKFAFIYGWASFTVFNTAGNASIAYVCTQYLGYFWQMPRLSPATEQAFTIHLPFIGNLLPLENIGQKLMTVLLVVLLTFINSRSVQQGGQLQKLLTVLKVLAIALLVIGLYAGGQGNFSHLQESLPVANDNLLGAYMAAIAGAFWAYDGWNNITFIAGEIKEPQKNIPKALIYGLGFCILVYCLINLAFLYVLPIHQIAGSAFIASDAAQAAFGSIGGALMAALIFLSTLGAANANVLATARVTYTMGNANRLFRWAGQTNTQHQTPANALWLNCIWTCIMVFSGSFDMLTDMLIFVTWFFYAMSALGLIILRKKMPTANRPYKVWGYPVVPMVFFGFAICYLLNTLYFDIQNYRNGKAPIIQSVLGLAIALSGLLVYRKKQ
jgi:basic amino acid/polyamine antiporter, APA family